MKCLLDRPRRGQMFVELALVLPFVLWVVLGIVDFGRMYYFYNAATNAAREGARYWASTPTATTTAIKARVQAEAQPQVSIVDSLITTSMPTFDERRVQVEYDFVPITPLISNLFPPTGTLRIRTYSVMPKLTN